MTNYLKSIRDENNNVTFEKKVLNTCLVLLLGIFLGIFSKYLDNLEINNSIFFHRVVEKFDLNNFFSGMSIWLFIAILISVNSKSALRSAINVFVFFIGMCSSYHLYTILYSGFNPRDYMMVWYTFTMISPALAFICWYAKGEKVESIIISALILFVMISSCFNVGLWYFELKSILELIVFILTCYALYTKPINICLSIIFGLLLALFIRLPYISG